MICTLYKYTNSDTGKTVYCYAEGSYVSYWQSTLYKALTCQLTYTNEHTYPYGAYSIIYQSDQPITKDSHPEYFI